MTLFGVAFFGAGSSSSSSSSTTFLALPRFFGGSLVSLGIAVSAEAAGLPPKNDLMSDGIVKCYYFEGVCLAAGHQACGGLVKQWSNGGHDGWLLVFRR
jgi:hypothetical protein